MMYLQAFERGRVPHAPENETLARLGAHLVDLFDDPASAERRGLYVVSSNAGFLSSLQFWSGAKQTGVGFANPELFPWTLSNAPCGWLARRFEIKGPNVTCTGEADALLAAFSQAEEHLETGQVDTGWVIAIDFAQAPRQRTVFAAMRVSAQPAATVVRVVTAADEAPVRSPGLATMLYRFFDDVSAGRAATISDGPRAFLIEPCGTAVVV
jgi:3-oxoacyl-(acyl-carrier-protein) synthase